MNQNRFLPLRLCSQPFVTEKGRQGRSKQKPKNNSEDAARGGAPQHGDMLGWQTDKAGLRRVPGELGIHRLDGIRRRQARAKSRVTGEVMKSGKHTTLQNVEEADHS